MCSTQWNTCKKEVTEVIVLKCKQSVFKCQARQLTLEKAADGYFSLQSGGEHLQCNLVGKVDAPASGKPALIKHAGERHATGEREERGNRLQAPQKHILACLFSMLSRIKHGFCASVRKLYGETTVTLAWFRLLIHTRITTINGCNRDPLQMGKPLSHMVTSARTLCAFNFE